MPGTQGCLGELMTPSLGCCLMPGPKLLHPCLPWSGKKQLSKLCAACVGRQQCVWATSRSSTSLHGVYIPSQSLLTTCPGTYGCYWHCKTFRRDWFDRPLLPFSNSRSKIHLEQLATGCPILQMPQSWVLLVYSSTVAKGQTTQ